MVRRILGLVVAVASLLAFATSPAAARARLYYLALGDSLAAGYQPDPAISRDEGYVARIHRALDHGLILENLACDGATTATLLSGGGGCAYEGTGSQLAAAENFLRQHRVRLITIDIGGNDVNHCVAGGVIDQACAVSAVGTTATNLGEIVRRLRAAAPGVQIVAMTYYDPYLAAWLQGPAGQTVARQSLDLTALLNKVLTGVYTAGDVRIADVAAVFATADLSTEAELPGAGTVPLAVARVCTWTWMCVPGRPADIHPTSAGYAQIADAFLAQVRRRPTSPAGPVRLTSD
jgi:lysophospholipase L1-like esterase